jgi:hypothetical protein
MADAIRDRARRGDLLQVYGYEPNVYHLSGLTSPSRFFIEFLFVDPDPAMWYRRQDWLIEHWATLEQQPPRFLVGPAVDRVQHDFVLTRGYAEVTQIGSLILYDSGLQL